MGNLGCCDGISANTIQIRFHKQIFQINANLNDSIAQVKTKISHKNSVSIRIIILTYNGVALQDNQTLLEIGFNNKEDHLILSMLEEIQTSFTVKVRNINFTGAIEVKSSDKVKQVKKKISRKHSADASLQRLIFNGQILQNDEQIGKYGVYQGCVIHLAIMLK